MVEAESEIERSPETPRIFPRDAKDFQPVLSAPFSRSRTVATKEATVPTSPSSLLCAAARTTLLVLSLMWLCPDPASANAVNGWNASAGRAALAACIAPGDDPLHESRMYAMMHVAIHDALNAIQRRSRPYAYNAIAPAGASADAAIAAAARDVLVAAIAEVPAPFPQACRDAGIASAEADYVAALSLFPPVPPGRRASRSARRRQPPSWRAASVTVPIRRSRTSISRKAPRRASGASPIMRLSLSHPGGATSGPSCCSTRTSSGPPHRTP